MCAIGSYTSNSNVFDVWVLIGFGLLGYVLRKFRYELAPFIFALILGPMFEQSLRQSLIISKQDPMIFFTRPISCGFLALPIASMAWVPWSQARKKISIPGEKDSGNRAGMA